MSIDKARWSIFFFLIEMTPQWVLETAQIGIIWNMKIHAFNAPPPKLAFKELQSILQHRTSSEIVLSLSKDVYPQVLFSKSRTLLLQNQKITSMLICKNLNKRRNIPDRSRSESALKSHIKIRYLSKQSITVRSCQQVTWSIWKLIEKTTLFGLKKLAKMRRTHGNKTN